MPPHSPNPLLAIQFACLFGAICWGWFALVFHVDAGRRHPVACALWPIAIPFYAFAPRWMRAVFPPNGAR